jgi:SAM-dependent methyltransferase
MTAAPAVAAVLPPLPTLPADHPLAQSQGLRFLAALQQALAQGRLVKLVLAKPQGAEPGLERITARPIVLRGEASLSFLFKHSTRDITRNFSHAEGLAQVLALLGQTFRNAHLFTPGEELQIGFTKKGAAQLSRHALPLAEGDTAAAAATPQSHDRAKQRELTLDRPFLAALGVTTAQGQLVPAMARKWKQINRFIEVFAHALDASPLAQAPALHVVDFGSGKGYLTFALHDWLRQVRGVDAQVTGVELRPDMVNLCNDAIATLGLTGLRIEQGDVRSYHPATLNVMVALHACDIATDHAIHLGVRSGADIIICSPCCHKEVRPQLLSPHPIAPILQYGVHQGQQAEMLTDGLRALLLEAQGYDTQVFEFISLEHTNKNKMILGVKRRQAQPAAAAEAVLAQIAALKQFYGVQEQRLEQLLAGREFPASGRAA